MKTFVIRPEDTDFAVLGILMSFIKSMLANKVRIAVDVRKYVESKTPPQNRTIFMWNVEVAAQLNVMGAMCGAATTWTKNDVHEMIFKGMFMPQQVFILPDGTERHRPMGLSDKGASKEIVSDAMEKYQHWAINHGIELTQPDGAVTY